MVLTNCAPKGGHQWGGIVKGAVDVRRPGVDRSAEQVDIGRLAVDGLTIAQDSEERVSRHRRAGGEGDGGVDN